MLARPITQPHPVQTRTSRMNASMLQTPRGVPGQPPWGYFRAGLGFPSPQNAQTASEQCICAGGACGTVRPQKLRLKLDTTCTNATRLTHQPRGHAAGCFVLVLPQVAAMQRLQSRCTSHLLSSSTHAPGSSPAAVHALRVLLLSQQNCHSRFSGMLQKWWAGCKSTGMKRFVPYLH